MWPFKKRGKTKEEKGSTLPDLPSSSEQFLPKTPVSQQKESEKLPPLPSLPPTSTANDFSKNMIKEAVAGKKERTLELPDYPEKKEEALPLPEPAAIPMEPIKNPLTREINDAKDYRHERELFLEPPVPIKRPVHAKRYVEMDKTGEPIFVKLEKFEEGLNSFEEIKTKTANIQESLKNIKEIKEKEEHELLEWEEEIRSIIRQIEKIDRDIFSRI